ncbi:hypothetical protein IWQ60_002966 [Tieghemiomyces parasiticus]|uniref:Mitochondrial carrier n=1 Tax=Tieghemiomyces parasiticus TaxID=78921 RepID=A0A9W8ADS3_9FUNG|nr:hypothetical protein IWQ60_002966 [Tieghemiomyces parasiticus]
MSLPTPRTGRRDPALDDVPRVLPLPIPQEDRPARPITGLDRVHGFLAGVASGVTKLAVGHPFDTVKVRLQTEGGFGRFKGPVDCLRNTIRQEGFLALYKGATPPLLGWAVMDSVQLGTLSNLRLCLQNGDKNKQLSVFEHGLAGLGAGFTVSFVATPVELLKIKLQVQYADSATRLYTGPIDCIRKIVVGTIAFRSFFWSMWGGYELYSIQLRKFDLPQSTVNFVAGGLAANTFWTLAFAVDSVKNRYMSQPDVRPLKYPNLRSVYRDVYTTEGLRGFYRGFLPAFIRSFPTNASAILVFETVMRFMNEHT